jgi:hypothetical protein
VAGIVRPEKLWQLGSTVVTAFPRDTEQAGTLTGSMLLDSLVIVD